MAFINMIVNVAGFLWFLFLFCNVIYKDKNFFNLITYLSLMLGTISGFYVCVYLQIFFYVIILPLQYFLPVKDKTYDEFYTEYFHERYSN